MTCELSSDFKSRQMRGYVAAESHPSSLDRTVGAISELSAVSLTHFREAVVKDLRHALYQEE